MPIRNSVPVRFIPTGLSDASDQASAFPGSCQSLSNWVFDRQNRGSIIPRPGVSLATSFGGFNTPGIISAQISVGTRIYGLISTTRNAGKDEPFCYDTATQSFVTISNVTSSNAPATQPGSGPWTPPTMDVVGGKVVVTHPGFSGSNYFGWFDISGFVATPTATTASGNATLTSVSSTVGILPGMGVSGTGIPANTTVLSTTSNSIVMSNNASASATVTVTVTGGSMSAPQWGAGNTTTNALPSIPIWVSQFYGRAYFGCGNAVYFSDSLSALTISNTNFAAVLTLGDSTNTTAAGGLPSSASSAGVLQSLIVFKDSSVWQITGDISGPTSVIPFSLNEISGNVGCSMPRTLATTPYGLIFIGSDGPRIVDLNGQVNYLKQVNESTPDIIAPFSNCTSPSRACAAYNNGVYRVALDTIIRNISVSGVSVSGADFWFDFLFGRWNGVHTFPYNSAVPIGSAFYLASNIFPGKLFKSEVVPTSSTIYLDNGSAILCSLLSATMPPTDPMKEKAVVESTVELSNATSDTSYNITAYSDQYVLLANCALVVPGTGNAWGSVIWGSFKWSTSFINNHPYTIPWPNPIVFKKLIYSITVTAGQNIAIRESDFRYQELGYTNAP